MTAYRENVHLPSRKKRERMSWIRMRNHPGLCQNAVKVSKARGRRRSRTYKTYLCMPSMPMSRRRMGFRSFRSLWSFYPDCGRESRRPSLFLNSPSEAEGDMWRWRTTIVGNTIVLSLAVTSERLSKAPQAADPIPQAFCARGTP